MIDADVPVWLLDVDGVLNVDATQWREPLVESRVWLAPKNRHYTIKYAQPLLNYIREVHESGCVELRWCTTWCLDPTGLEKLWGLPQLTREPIAGLNGWAAIVAKTHAAKRVIESGRRLIWTDDSVVPKFRDQVEKIARDGQCLLIGPYSRYGLGIAHVQEIESFIKNGGNERA
jgi:hypothetical protein